MGSSAHTGLYRATGGKLGGRMGKNPILLLNTVGRKSGKKRVTPLLYVVDGEDYVIIASQGGAPTHLAWFLNLVANPETTIEVGDLEVRVKAEEVDAEEKHASGRRWSRYIRPTMTTRTRRSVRSRSLYCTRYASVSAKRRIVVKIISREDLKGKIDGGDEFVLLEVLSEQSYTQGHLPGAIRLQGRDMIEDLLPDKSTEVVAYCSNFN